MKILIHLSTMTSFRNFMHFCGTNVVHSTEKISNFQVRSFTYPSHTLFNPY